MDDSHLLEGLGYYTEDLVVRLSLEEPAALFSTCFSEVTLWLHVDAPCLC